MVTAKEELKKLLEAQPEDSSSEELVRELAFHLLVQRGLADSGRTVSNDDNESSNSLMAETAWTDEASRWLEEIFDYIAAENPEAATNVVLGIYEQAQVLAAHPKMGYRYLASERNVRILVYVY